mgnify:CR=1 FL=1
MKQNNSLNVRRLVGAILLALFAIGIFLEQADQLMFDLAKSTTPKDDILKVAQLLKEAGVLQDTSDDLKTIW